jgi:hypothetical protein
MEKGIQEFQSVLFSKRSPPRTTTRGAATREIYGGGLRFQEGALI